MHLAQGELEGHKKSNVANKSPSRPQKRKLTPAEKAAKRQRRKEYMTIFINSKQKRVKRPPTIEGMEVEEFIRRNADPIWLHQNEMWEYMHESQSNPASDLAGKEWDDENIPF